MKIVILGPPVSGTSTFSSILSSKFNLLHISPGNIFQENIIKKTPLGIKAKKFYDKGLLVPDDITIDLIISRLKETDCEKGFVLEGFPRSIKQAEALDEFTKIDFFIYVNIPEWLAVKRITSRRVCKNCKRVYSLINVKPKIEGICDVCGGELIQRADDNPESIKKRFREFEEKTKPVLEHYKNKGMFNSILCDKMKSVPEENIEKILKIIRG
ncbi:MAG: adenylate kinase [Candidatus Aenigmarchaeota archaeon]|nr:adenylate kinase [Candidatus Aenigmarchaeota archaeon]